MPPKNDPEAPSSDPATASWAVESLFHFVVNASDFERSLAFYERLGFRVLRDNRDIIWPDFVAENFGMPRAQGRGALLGLGESEHHTRLDLIEWLEPKWQRPDPATPTGAVPRIMALRTRNLRAAYHELKAEGFDFIGSPQDPNPQTGVESVVCCRDPDGYIIELIEYMGNRLGSRITELETRSGAQS